jgi:molecular chaperone DnaK (HSP70)
MGIVDGEDVVVENTIELTSGTLRFNSDATFAVTHVYRTTGISYSMTTGEPVDTAVTTDPVTESGTFTVTGTSVQMTFSNGTANTGSLSGDLLTVSVDGVAWLYGR